ncbi:MAG: tetratricopeptide repeat protein [Bacteroidetes bacterium]|nr:tetratricopeptide repeat protein [Bacteroidota bacterium]
MIDGKYREAIKDLDSLITIDSANVQALYFLGLNYESISNYNKAASVLKSAVKYKPDDAKLLLSVGSNCFSAGLITDAETVLSKAFSLDSTSSQIQLILGKVYMNEKKWDDAASIYPRLIKSDSTNSYFYEQLAQCRSNQGNAKEAIRSYQIANKLNPKNQNTILNLSYLLFLNEQLDSAIAVVNAGLVFYPRSTVLLNNLGDFYLNLKKPDYDRAIMSYLSAFHYGDSSSTVLKDIGICLYWKKDYSSSINFLEHSEELDPKVANTFFYLGASYKGIGKYKNALENYNKAASLLRDNFLANTLVQIGAIHQIEGKYHKALEFYKDAFKESQFDKSPLFYIAAIYDKLKDEKLAVNYYEQYLFVSKNQDKKLIDYAQKRVSELKNNKSLKR